MKFVSYHEDLLPELTALFAQSMVTSYPLEYFRDRYKSDDKGYSHFIFDDSGIPGAFLGVFPAKLMIGGQAIRAVQFVDGMSNPLFRGKGYFKKLALHVFNSLKDDGIATIYGFPNALAYPVWKSLGWVFPANMNAYHIWVPTLPLSVVSPPLHLQAAFRGFVRRRVFPETDGVGFVSSTQTAGADYAAKDDRYISLKRYNGNWFSTVHGMRVWMKLGRSLEIGDIEWPGDPGSAWKIVRTIMVRAFRSGIVRIDFYLSPGCLWDHVLRAQRGASPATPMGFWKIRDDVDVDRVAFVASDYDTF
jgi:hypothetical protein